MTFTSVLLDVFGTLIDIEEDVYLSPYSHLLLALGLDSENKRRAYRYILTSRLPTMNNAADALESLFPGHPISADSRRRAAAELDEHLRYFGLVDGVSELLPRVKAAGLNLAFVSNLATPYERLITDHKLDRLTDATVYSFEVGFQKPEPQIFEIALDRIGCEAAQAVMIGDDEINDYEVPRSLGIESRLVEPGGQDGGTSLKQALTWVLSKTEADV